MKALSSEHSPFFPLSFRFFGFLNPISDFLNFLQAKNVEKQEKGLKINSHIQDEDMTIQ